MADITGSKAVTNAVISPNVELQIGNFTIGYARQVTETQARPVNPIYEIGTVGIVEMVPGQPAPVTLSLEHVAIYGATMINVIALAIDSGNLAGISAAAGLSAADTATALQIWLQQRLGANATMGDVFSLSDMPVGFQCKIKEQSPISASAVFITTYNNCWITRYTRPVKATGDLLVVETMDISAQSISTKQGSVVTQDKIEVIA
jgi:hypothetical protein